MTRFHFFAAALAAAAAGLLPALPALAEQPAPSSSSAAAPSDPSDPGAAVAPLSYRSPFAGYRPLGGAKVGWKEANDEVGRIGGWRTYAREARASEPAASTAPGRGAHQHHEQKP